jgi:pimeloyl-ACP methyl ester carboxylesterase
VRHPRERRVVLEGGRTVAVAEYGSVGGPVVMAFHGTPAGRLMFDLVHEPALARGLRVVCPDRPGIGGSDPAPERTISSYAEDVVQLADALSIDRFGVLGYSGGGPYALACASALPHRLLGVACMAGVGPLDRDGALDGLGHADRWRSETVVRSPELVRRRLQLEALAVRALPALALRSVLAELTPAEERWARENPQSLGFFADACRGGAHGVTLDCLLWALPWDLDWASITTRVHLFHGDADTLVPLQHLETVASLLPDPVRHVLPGLGHLSIQERYGSILDAASGR